MRRREFIAGLGSATATWPAAVRAQPRAMPVVGFLNSASPELYEERLCAFHRGLREAGFVEGRNVTLEYRWAKGEIDRLPALAADLVRDRVTAIAAIGSNFVARAAKDATTTIPIVFATGGDPVQAGLVASLNRPGGNLTGVTNLGLEVAPKRLELLRELIPAVTSIGLLVNPTDVAVTEVNTQDLHTAARTLGLQLRGARASTERELDAAFASLVQLRVGGVVIGNDVFFSSQREQLAALSVRHGLPAIANFRDFVTAGGLMSYGGSGSDQHRMAGDYIGRILKGEKPADLSVQQSTKVELVLNLKTAKALGLAFPLTLLGRADEVIE